MSVKVKNQGTGASDAGEGTGNTSQEGGTPNKGESKQESSGSTGNAEGEEEESEEDSEKLDVSKLDPKVQKLIKDLRNENAGSRQKNKSLVESHGKLKTALVEAGLIEDDEEAPEEKVKVLSAHNESVVVQNAILQMAIEHGVGKADIKFFQFLVADRASELEEDGELSEEDIAELAQQARRGASQSGNSSTSVTQGSGNPPPPGANGAVTLEKFVKMNMSEKTDLYVKNKELYEQLKNEAKAKKILV